MNKIKLYFRIFCKVVKASLHINVSESIVTLINIYESHLHGPSLYKHGKFHSLLHMSLQ